MTTALDHARRVAQIGRYEVLVSPPRQDLLALVEVAAQVAQVPMATINLITDAEQHQVATYGFDGAVCRREDSMCSVILDDGDPVVVSDASLDPRWRENPFVTGELGRVRFYATHPLTTPEGVAIGTLCVFDEEPRTLTPQQEHALAGLADRVVDLLELELRTRELERSNEQLAAFAGQVSHDLRNPLTAVTMSLMMLREEIDPDEADRAFLVQRAVGGARRMETLIDDLLKFARVGGELQRGPVDLGALLREVVEDLAGPLAEASIGTGDLPTVLGDADRAFLLQRAMGGARRMQTLIDDLLKFARVGGELQRGPVDLGALLDEVVEDLAGPLAEARVTRGDLPTVFGDAVQLRAVLQNLVANAAKFVRPGNAPRIDVRAVHLDGRWRIEVCDQGRGIPEDQRERVFEPLARVDDDVEGSGIGLSTCRRIITAHGGRIGLENVPDGGTCAWFELPD